MLTTTQLQTLVPSAFASHPKEDVSDRYQYVSTTDFLERAAKLGWYPIKANQSRSKDPQYGQHRIVLSNPNLGLGNNEYQPTLHWFNSHNRTKAAHCFLGVLRGVCDNGLYIGTMYASMKFVHLMGQRDCHTDQIERILDAWPRVEATIKRYQETPMTIDSQLEYTKMALGLRYPDRNPYTLEVEGVNRPRRYEDKADNLWCTYNRVQEKLVQGWRAWNIKAIKSLDRQDSFDRQLETLTANFAGIAH